MRIIINIKLTNKMKKTLSLKQIRFFTKMIQILAYYDINYIRRIIC